MRGVSCSGWGLVRCGLAACPLQSMPRHVSVAGGGRGDLFKRHASQYKAPFCGAARGIRQVSESTEPQDGQLHIRKRHDHIAFDRMYSGGAHYRPAIVAWSYLIPSLRQNVEVACPAALYEKLQAGEAPLSAPEEQQLAEAQSLFRFELQQRIGLLEDSLAEAELPYLIQWPSLFQRVWLRLPLQSLRTAEDASEHGASVAAMPAQASLSLSTTETNLLPVPTAVWASSSAVASTAPSSAVRFTKRESSAGTSLTTLQFAARLEMLTKHVVECVEAELRQLEAGAPPREDGAPRSRRQVALEAAWRAQWQSVVRWHADEPQHM